MTTKWRCDKCKDITIEKQSDLKGGHGESMPETGWGCEKCSPPASGKRVKIVIRKKLIAKEIK